MRLSKNLLLLGIIATGTTGLLVQKFRMDAGAHGQSDTEKQKCECLGSEQPTKADVNGYHQSFSNVLYGAYVNPNLIRDALNRNGAKETSPNIETRQSWDSMRGPK